MKNYERESFKLIALSILPGCMDSIKKCLKEGILYYFCNDRIIDFDTNRLVPKSKNLEPLDSYFFDLDLDLDGVKGKRHPVINISAIAGKNGDGKSSLIEVMLRLINNFKSCRAGNDHLLYVSGVRACLYYQIGTRLFKLEESSIQNKKGSRIGLFELVDSGIKEVVGESDPHYAFFHTIVSNYSHYAYNIYDYKDEWDLTINSRQKDDKCWIHRILCNTDPEQTPITVFPYRERGIIDINSESDLAKQRLIALLLSSNEEELSVFLENKPAEYIEIKKEEYSKFEQETIRAFFLDVRDTVLLDEETAFLERIQKKGFLSEEDVETFRYSISASLMQMFRKFFKKNKKLINAFFLWKSRNSFPLNSKRSDIAQVIDGLESIESFNERKSEQIIVSPIKKEIDQIRSIYRAPRMEDKGTNLDQFSILQVQRLEIVSQVFELWSKELGFTDSIELLFKHYDQLTETERCIHYLVYKTISVFRTMPTFGFPILIYETEPVLFRKRAFATQPYIRKKRESVSSSMEHAFHCLQKSLHGFDTNELLKLNQTLNNCHSLQDGNPYNDVLRDRKKSFKYRLAVMKKRTLDLRRLPPPLFNTTLFFRQLNDDSVVPLRSLSSGEKQHLFTLSSILYHFISLDSSPNNKYVNAILEEIELYFHPESQRSFVFQLLRALNKMVFNNILAINLIFVTHSPFILSDIPLSNVLFLEDGMPVNKMQDNTFGSNINGLLKNGFFLPKLPIGEFAYSRISDLFKIVSQNDYQDEQRELLRQQIMLIGEPYIRNELLKLMRPVNK